MSWTKRNFITWAFEELGLASYVFDLTPDQLQAAGRRLDAMVAQWETRGIRINYPFGGGPDIDIDAAVNVSNTAHDALTLGLAIRLAPSYGKTVSPDTKATFKAAYDSLLQAAAFPAQVQLGAMPAGAGHKGAASGGSAFLPSATDILTTGNDGPLEF